MIQCKPVIWRPTGFNPQGRPTWVAELSAPVEGFVLEDGHLYALTAEGVALVEMPE